MGNHTHTEIHGDDETNSEPAINADRLLNQAMRKAWRYWAKKGRRPKTVAKYVLGLGEYWAERDKWLSDVGRIKRESPLFTDLYRRVRLSCEQCDGYLVVRGRGDRAFRFAGCSEYTSSGCRCTMTSRDYARVKSEVVLALIAGDEPDRAFFMLDRAAVSIARRKKGTRTRVTVT